MNCNEQFHLFCLSFHHALLLRSLNFIFIDRKEDERKSIFSRKMSLEEESLKVLYNELSSGNANLLIPFCSDL